MRIQITTTKKGRINVFADGEYFFTVFLTVWQKSGLCEGCEATKEQLEALRLAGEREEAYENAIRYLSCRAYGEQELFRKLKLKYSVSASEAAVLRCKENGFINDQAYALAVAEYLYQSKHYSSRRILGELIAKGVAREIAADAAKGYEQNSYEGILAFLEKIRYNNENADEKQRARVIRRLMNMGYSVNDIKKCMDMPKDINNYFE